MSLTEQIKALSYVACPNCDAYLRLVDALDKEYRCQECLQIPILDKSPEDLEKESWIERTDLDKLLKADQAKREALMAHLQNFPFIVRPDEPYPESLEEQIRKQDEWCIEISNLIGGKGEPMDCYFTKKQVAEMEKRLDNMDKNSDIIQQNIKTHKKDFVCIKLTELKRLQFLIEDSKKTKNYWRIEMWLKELLGDAPQKELRK